MIFQASNHVFCVNLDELISEAVSHSGGVSPWQSLTNTPLMHFDSGGFQRSSAGCWRMEKLFHLSLLTKL